MNSDNKKKYLLIDIILIGFLIALDQFTKNLAVEYLMDKDPIVIIKDVFELRYLENRGAAFGIFQNKQFFFLVVSSLFVVLLTYVLFKIPRIKKYRIFEISVCFLYAGAIGNMIDRSLLNYVVDFFYFSLIDFPIFNVADIYVTLSAISVGIIFIFVFKEEDFSFLSLKKEQQSDE